MKFLKTHYGRAIPVIPSNDVDIPNPAGLGSTGTATATTAGSLVDSSASFTTNLLGAVVVNKTDNTIAYVTGFTSATTLVLSNDIMASGEEYYIYKSDNNQGCSLYIPAQTPANLVVVTIGGDTVKFEGCGSVDESIILPISVLRVLEDTTITDIVALW